MRPIDIFWPSVTDTEDDIAASQLVTSGVPLVLNYNYSVPNLSVSVNGNVPGNLVPIYGNSPRYSVIPNLGTGPQIPSYKMPSGNVRSLSITAASGSLGTTQFRVTGFDENGNALTITGTAATVETIFFSIITSIVPQATLAGGNNVQVGLGADGRISLLTMDSWNKANNYTLAYEVESGDIQVTPYYTVRPTRSVVDGVITNLLTFSQDPSSYYVLPVTNVNIIASPAAANVLPVDQSAAFSVVGIPLTGLLTVVTNTTGAFTQTVLQQGGIV